MRGGECADRERNGRKREKKRKERWGGWERWNVEVGEGTAERGGESDEEEEGEVHTPCGGLTEAMWDCSWNNKRWDVSGGLEDKELLTCWTALSNSLDSATDRRTRNDLSCMVFTFYHNIIPVPDSCGQIFSSNSQFVNLCSSVVRPLLCISSFPLFFFFTQTWLLWKCSLCPAWSTAVNITAQFMFTFVHDSHTLSSLFGLEAADTKVTSVRPS